MASLHIIFGGHRPPPTKHTVASSVADPNPACHFDVNADPDPTFHFETILSCPPRIISDMDQIHNP
jgi:hypothetical protein